MTSIEKKFLQTIRAQKLVTPGQSILLAVSGGADSVAMLFLFHRLRQELGIKISLAHFNHQLRGLEADRDEAFVKRLSRELKIPGYFGQGRVAQFAKKAKTSLENAARISRYKFLKDVARKIKADRIATAHTADDQAETFFMRLVRGSTRRGGRGILFEREDRIIRPLLDIRRPQIEEFLKKNKIKFCRDSSNRNWKFLRNRIRYQLMPLLEKINPRVKEVIIRNSALLQEEEAWLEELTGQTLKKVICKDGKNLKLDLKKINRLAVPLKRRILKKISRRMAGADKETGARHVESILNQLTVSGGRRSFCLHLPGPVYVVKEKSFLIFSKKPPVFQKKEFCYKITPNKNHFIPEINKNVAVKVAKKIPGLKKIQKSAPATLYLDFEKAGSRLFLRSRRPGDRFQPLGQKKSKKLKEFLIDRKISLAQKDNYPVLANKSGEILAVFGLEVSENFKITQSTRKALKFYLC